MKYKVKYVSYNCHPETCCHRNHLPWRLVHVDTGVVELGFEKYSCLELHLSVYKIDIADVDMSVWREVNG